MFRLVPKTLSLAGGSSLWILQTPETSPLAKKIDWHTRFIFKKSKTVEGTALLIESSLCLPNSQTLFIPFDPKNKASFWIEQAFQNWKKLNKPSLKLFLPPPIQKEDLFEHWPAEDLPYKIHIVLE